MVPLVGGHRLMKFGRVTYFLVDGIDTPLLVTSIVKGYDRVVLDKNCCAMDGLIIKFLEDGRVNLYVPDPAIDITMYCCDINEEFIRDCQARHIFAPLKQPETGLFEWIC